MLRTLLLLTLLLSSPLFAAERITLESTIEVEDGDTLIIDIDGQRTRIQLAGIDAPEDRDNPKFRVDLRRTRLEPEQLLPLGRVATEQLRFLIREQGPFILHFDPQRPDRYGRTPGDLVNAQGDSVAAQMVANGYAIPLGRGLPADLAHRLGALEARARDDAKGLWGLYPQAARRWAGRSE
jgi:micrococcal nuclease